MDPVGITYLQAFASRGDRRAWGAFALAKDRHGREAFLELLKGHKGRDTGSPAEATYGWEWLAALLKDAANDMCLARRLRMRRALPGLASGLSRP